MTLHRGGCWSSFVVCISVASPLVGGGGVVFAQQSSHAQRQEPVGAEMLPACCAADVPVFRLRADDAQRCTALPYAQRIADDRCISGWDPGPLLLEYDDLLARCPSCAAITAADRDALRRMRIALLEETFHTYGMDFHVNYWDRAVRRGMVPDCTRMITGFDGIPVTERDAADVCTLDPTAHIRCALDVPGAVIEYLALLKATHAPQRKIRDVALFLHRHNADPRPFMCKGCAVFTPLPPTVPRP